MRRTMGAKDFATFQELAIKYNLSYEVIQRNDAWVCVYIG